MTYSFTARLCLLYYRLGQFVAVVCFNSSQKQRDLENRLDKSSLKCREAEHIQKTYLQIKIKLEDEQKSFGNTLDGMQQDIVRSDAGSLLARVPNGSCSFFHHHHHFIFFFFPFLFFPFNGPIETNYLRIYWSNLHQIFRIWVLAVAQGTLLW